MKGLEYITSQRCKLGHNILLDDCPEDCLDYESQMPDPHKTPASRK